MTDTPQDQPLWRVMHQAYDNSSHPQWEERHGMAAEIRAVANWMVPRAWLAQESKRGEFADFRVRKWIRHRLLAEADRAERGDA